MTISWEEPLGLRERPSCVATCPETTSGLQKGFMAQGKLHMAMARHGGDDGQAGPQ